MEFFSSQNKDILLPKAQYSLSKGFDICGFLKQNLSACSGLVVLTSIFYHLLIYHSFTHLCICPSTRPSIRPGETHLQFQHFLPCEGSSISATLVLSALCSRTGREIHLIGELGSCGVVLSLSSLGSGNKSHIPRDLHCLIRRCCPRGAVSTGNVVSLS